MTKRQFLMSTTSTLKPHVVVPADFADDPISRFWRGVMFGWDADRELEFQGLVPRGSALYVADDSRTFDFSVVDDPYFW